jgi:hypothetical protein
MSPSQERVYLDAEREEGIAELRNDPAYNFAEPECIVPSKYHQYFVDYGRCLYDKFPLRQEMHAFNHYKKFHWHKYPRYLAYQGGTWHEVSIGAYLAAKFGHLIPVAIVHDPKKPKNKRAKAVK